MPTLLLRVKDLTVYAGTHLFCLQIPIFLVVKYFTQVDYIYISIVIYIGIKIARAAAS